MTDRVYEILMRPRKIRAEIGRINAEIEGLRLSMLPGAIRYDSDKVQSSPDDPMSRYAERMETLESKRDRLRTEYLDAQDDIVQKISMLPDEREALVLEMRFVGGSDFKTIADEISTGIRNMFRIYHQAIMDFDKVVSECQ